MSVESPHRAAIRAKAAVTVVLPTPPFPATMTSPVCEQKRAGSTRSFLGGSSIRSRPAVSTLAIASLCLGLWWPASAGATPPAGGIDVIEVSGSIDPVVRDFIADSLRRAERAASVALVVQLDSGGTLLSAAELDALDSELARARVPVAVWVGPSGARAARGALRLVRAAAVTGIAPGSHV